LLSIHSGANLPKLIAGHEDPADISGLWCECVAWQNDSPIKPLHPERVCWGCDRYCAADSLLCGNGSERTQHPAELFGEDWQEFGIDAQAGDAIETVDAQPPGLGVARSSV
jgi:hypothetical protein